MNEGEHEVEALAELDVEAQAERDVEALVARALVAIDDDAPDYGEPLRALLASSAALAILARRPDLTRPLCTELRKLRPVTLWVRDGVESALALKRDLVLDGALCTLAPGTLLLRPEGRECWLETEASSAESTLRGLPAGWGLLVTGDLGQVSFQALRRVSPLRALGALLLDSALVPDSKLDLVVVADAASVLDETRGARVLWSVASPEALQLAPDREPSVGVLCDGKDALVLALCLATMRQPTPRSR